MMMMIRWWLSWMMMMYDDDVWKAAGEDAAEASDRWHENGPTTYLSISTTTTSPFVTT
jgi:hypothetical protein